MSKKSIEKKPETEVMVTPTVEKPKRERKNKKSKALSIDIESIKKGLESSFMNGEGGKLEKSIGVNEKIPTPENEAENVGREDLEDEGGYVNKKGGRGKMKKQSTTDPEKDIPTRTTQTYEEILEKSIRRDTKIKKPFAKLIEKSEEKVQEISVENSAEKAEELHEMLLFLDKHRDYLLEKYEKENNNKKREDIERKLEVVDYRISILNKARIFFVNPSKNNDLTEDEWFEARGVKNDVKERMEMEKEQKEGVEKREISQEEISEKEKEIYGPYKYIENHRDFLLKLREQALRKKTPNKKKIEEIERKIDGMNNRIEILLKAREALLNPENVTLTQNEKNRIEEIKKEVLEKIEEQKLKKEQKEQIEEKFKKVEPEIVPEEKKSETKPPQKPIEKNVSVPVISTKNQAPDRKVEQVKTIINNDARPLKTQYEKALERTERNNNSEMVSRKNEIPEIDNQNVLSSKKEIASTEKDIAGAQSFDELLSVIEKIDGIQGTQKWFSKYALIGRINLVRAREITPDYIPTSAGLRDKIEELLESDGSLIYRHLGFSNTKDKTNLEKNNEKIVEPKKVEEPKVVESTPEPLKTVTAETPEKDINFKKQAEKLFSDRIESILTEITPLRAQYGKQIKIKTQHEHNQTRIGGLMTRLFRPFSRKESSNEVEFENTKKEYLESLDNLKNVLNEENINNEAVKMSVELGAKGLDMILEVKIKVFEQLTKTLLKEAQLIEDLKTDGLPEGHKKIKSKLEQLAKVYRKKGGKIIPEKIVSEEIIGDNLESNA